MGPQVIHQFLRLAIYSETVEKPADILNIAG